MNVAVRRYAGKGHIAVELVPVFFKLRRNLAHGAAIEVIFPWLAGQLFELRVYFQHPVIDRASGFIHDNLRNTEALMHGIEQ